METLITASFPYGRGIARVRGRLGERLGLDFVGIIGYSDRFLVEIDLDGAHPRHFFQGFPDRNWTQFARHVLDVERDGLRGEGQHQHCSLIVRASAQIAPDAQTCGTR